MNSATVMGPCCRMRSTMSARQPESIRAGVVSGSLLRDDHERLLAALSRGAVRAAPPGRIACSARLAVARPVSTVWPFIFRMTSPGRRPAPAAGDAGSTSVTSTPRVPAGTRSRRAIVGAERAERDAEPAARPPPAATSLAGCAPLSASRSSSSTVTDERSSPALSRRTCTGTVVPGFVAVTIWTSALRPATGLPLNSMMTSPGSTPAFAAGPFGVTIDDQRALALLQAELGERVARHVRAR